MKLTQGLVLDLPFADGSNSRFKDIVTGASGKWTNSPQTGFDPVYGTYMEMNGSNHYGHFNLTGRQVGLTQVTIEIIQKADAVGQYKRALHVGTSGDRTHSIEFDDGWGYVFNANWSGGGGAWSIPKPNVGDVDHFFWTYDWGATTNDPIIYKNGLSQTITERGAPSGNANNDYTKLWVGSSEDGGGQYWDGRIYLVRMWRRILTANEVLLLTYNPWVIYGNMDTRNRFGNVPGAITPTDAFMSYRMMTGVGV